MKFIDECYYLVNRQSRGKLHIFAMVYLKMPCIRFTSNAATINFHNTSIGVITMTSEIHYY
jgi:hypothetical protein